MKELRCDRIMVEFEGSGDSSKAVAKRRSDRLKAKSFCGLFAAMVTAAATAVPSDDLLNSLGEDIAATVKYLRGRQ